MTLERPTKPYGVYYRDTFEPPGENTWLVHEADTYPEAVEWIQAQTGFHLSPNGADRVEVVHFDATGRGIVLKQFSVG